MQFSMMSSETFLLFMIWTHPLQMREYPLQYASTDKNKKSHYSSKATQYCVFLTPICENFYPIWQPRSRLYTVFLSVYKICNIKVVEHLGKE